MARPNLLVAIGLSVIPTRFGAQWEGEYRSGKGLFKGSSENKHGPPSAGLISTFWFDQVSRRPKKSSNKSLSIAVGMIRARTSENNERGGLGGKKGPASSM